MNKLLPALLTLAAAPLAAETFTPVNLAQVTFVVWRGCEEACQGFTRFFSERELPVEVTVIDVDKDADKLPGVRGEIISASPDLVVTWGTSVSVGIIGEMSEYGTDTAIGDIPSLFMIVADPVASDLVTGYEASGRPSVTGVRNRVPEETQIALLQDYIRTSKVGVINSPDEPNSVINTETLMALAPEAGFEIVSVEYTLNTEGKPDPAEIPALMAQVKAEGAEVVYVGSSSFNLENTDAFTEAAIAEGLPVFTAYAQMVQESNGLMAIANAYANVGKLAASQASKILFEEQSPSELPIAALDRYSVFINMTTAKRLGVYPPIQLINIAEIVQ